MTPLQWVMKSKIIAIVRGLSSKHILGLSNALYEGGIDLIEVTFNQENIASWKETAEAISSIAENMKEKILVGAGTVLNDEQLQIAIDAGAKYIVTPNVDPELISNAKAAGLCSFPGALTPSEIMIAHKAGADAVKVFPAGNFGPSYIKAIKAPLSHVRLLAVGGINERNTSDFIRAGCCGVGVGGNLVNKKWIENGEWGSIISLAKEFRKAIQEV